MFTGPWNVKIRGKDLGSENLEMRRDNQSMLYRHILLDNNANDIYWINMRDYEP